MTCPTCNLINSDSAIRCDCGYDFRYRSVQDSYLAEHQNKIRQDRSNNVRTAISIVFLLMLALRLLFRLTASH